MITKFTQFEGMSVTIHTNNNCTCKCSYCYEIDKAASVEEDEKFWSSTKHAGEKRSYDFIKKDCRLSAVSHWRLTTPGLTWTCFGPYLDEKKIDSGIL